MTSFRTVLLALATTAALAFSGCGAASEPTPTPTPPASTASQATPSDGPPSGAPGAGPTGKTMTAEANAKMAKDLGVTPTALTAALTEARASGAGVNLVKTLSAELNLPESTVAAELKTMGADGP